MKRKLKFKISEDDDQVGYLSLPKHPGRGKSNTTFKQIELWDLIDYNGPPIYLDFDKERNLIGIEIVG